MTVNLDPTNSGSLPTAQPDGTPPAIDPAATTTQPIVLGDGTTMTIEEVEALRQATAEGGTQAEINKRFDRMMSAIDQRFQQFGQQLQPAQPQGPQLPPDAEYIEAANGNYALANRLKQQDVANWQSSQQLAQLTQALSGITKSSKEQREMQELAREVSAANPGVDITPAMQVYQQLLDPNVKGHVLLMDIILENQKLKAQGGAALAAQTGRPVPGQTQTLPLAAGATGGGQMTPEMARALIAERESEVAGNEAIRTGKVVPDWAKGNTWIQLRILAARQA